LLQAAGSYSINFNADGLASGVYYCKLVVDNNVQMRKMVLMH